MVSTRSGRRDSSTDPSSTDSETQERPPKRRRQPVDASKKADNVANQPSAPPPHTRHAKYFFDDGDFFMLVRSQASCHIEEKLILTKYLCLERRMESCFVSIDITSFRIPSS